VDAFHVNARLLRLFGVRLGSFAVDQGEFADRPRYRSRFVPGRVRFTSPPLALT